MGSSSRSSSKDAQIRPSMQVAAQGAADESDWWVAQLQCYFTLDQLTLLTWTPSMSC